MIALLAALALAAEPPLPAPVAPVAGDCVDPVAVHVGDVARCSGVLLGVAPALDLRNHAAWGDAVDVAYRADTSAALAEGAAKDARIRALSRRPPLVVGIAVGAGAVVVLDVAIYELARLVAGGR